VAPLIDAIPFVNTLRDAVFLTGTVSEIEELTPRLRRIRLSSQRLKGLTWTPGQHIRLQVAGLVESALRLHPHDALRTYSIYDADPHTGSLDIVMLDHPGVPEVDTPARHWANAVAIGSHAQITRPQGNFVVRGGAAYHVFVGEETASVAFAAMLRSLPADSDVYGVVEGAAGSDQLPLARSLTQVLRGAAPAVNSPVLAEALRGLRLPDHPGVAYLAGEAKTVQTLKKILITERGWDRRDIRTKPFWTPGRAGME
jgi:NADPH-dependent ferric siderophore reductase